MRYDTGKRSVTLDLFTEGTNLVVSTVERGGELDGIHLRIERFDGGGVAECTLTLAETNRVLDALDVERELPELDDLT